MNFFSTLAFERVNSTTDWECSGTNAGCDFFLCTRRRYALYTAAVPVCSVCADRNLCHFTALHNVCAAFTSIYRNLHSANFPHISCSTCMHVHSSAARQHCNDAVISNTYIYFVASRFSGQYL